MKRSDSLLEAVWLFITLRVALSLSALFLALQSRLPEPCHFEAAHNGWRTMPALQDSGLGFQMVGVWQRWDACWYTKIAQYGYETGERSVAFFPLYPALLRVVETPFADNYALAGLIVSGIAYVIAMVGLHRLVSVDFDRETARRTMLYISVFPAAFFFFAPFSESLFLALAVWAIGQARRGAWLDVAVLGLLCALTRPQGVLLALPLAWEAFVAWRRGASLVPALAAVTPVLGFVGFNVWSALAVGDNPLAAQELWAGRDPFRPPWELVSASLSWITEQGDPLQALNLALLLGFVIITVVGARRIPISYTLFAAPQLLLLSTRILPIPLTSTTRLLLVLFPVFVVLALFGNNRRFHYSWLLLSLPLLGLLTYMFIRGDFVA